MHARVVLGVGKGVLFREVSSVQECPGFHYKLSSIEILRKMCFCLSQCWVLGDQMVVSLSLELRKETHFTLTHSLGPSPPFTGWCKTNRGGWVGGREGGREGGRVIYNTHTHMLYMCAVLSVIVYSIRTDPLLFCLHCPHLKAGNTPHILYVTYVLYTLHKT